MRGLREGTIALLLLPACGDDGNGADGGSTGGIEVTATATDPMTGGPKLDAMPGGDGGGDGPPGGCAGDAGGDCRGRLDLLFVIDNSGSMGEEQLNLARNMPLLVRQLENLNDVEGNEVDLDVHIMVTTTDVSNPLCAPFYHDGREPEMGAPISSACTDRLERFTSVEAMPVTMEEACTEVCPEAVAPDGMYIQFDDSSDNVPDVPPRDIDGDGMDDSALAQALACVGPQGIDGCGYERPLDAMRRALDANAEWNGGGGFLRDGGLLAVVIISDEADCSIADEAVMQDESYQLENPENMMLTPTSAVCWNAGVACDGPNNNGVYDSCASTGDALTPVSEYVDFLGGLGRPVVMLGILGVPEVTAHADEAPFQPIEGGVEALVYRDWQDPDYPNGGDILPDDWDAGRDAAYQQFRFGIGPGCTGQEENGDFTGQAIPPVRVKEVCEALDTQDEVRCCIESICDTDFSDAIRCLGGLVETNFVPES